MSAPEETSPVAEWLRAAYGDPAAGCPPPEAFLGYEMRALSPAERDRLEQHATGCAACQAERELAQAFEQGATAVDPKDLEWVLARAVEPAPKQEMPQPATVVPLRRRRMASWVRLAAAAVLVVAAGLAFQTFYLGSAPPLPDRGQPSVGRGGWIEPVAPVGELAEAPTELRWGPLAEAARYRVQLATVDERTLWTTTTEIPQVEIPPGLAAELVPAVTYLWSVEGLGAGGEVVGRSEAARFRIAPEPEAAVEKP